MYNQAVISSSSSVFNAAPSLGSTSYQTQLTQLIKERHSWYSQLEFNESSGIYDSPKFIDFSAEVMSQSPYIFPSHFDGVENKDTLITALRVMCMEAGFGSILRSSKSQKQLSKFHASCISLCCQQLVKTSLSYCLSLFNTIDYYLLFANQACLSEF